MATDEPIAARPTAARPADGTPASAAADAAAHTAAHAAADALRNGPIGAFVVASIAVGLLLLGWLAFYFLLFIPRGPSG